MPPRSLRSPFVTVAISAVVRTAVVGTAVVGTAACDKPAADTSSTDDSQATVRKPRPGGLPAWHEVESTHPKGATNPPHPVLTITRDKKRCFKTYEGGMSSPDDVLRLTVGKSFFFTRVVDTPPAGKEVQCPEGVAAALDAQDAGAQDAGAQDAGPAPSSS
jgi:hypothetical protein